MTPKSSSPRIDHLIKNITLIEQVASNRYKGRFIGNVMPVSSGSGFLVTEDGMILTNAHVVADAVNVEIKMQTGKTYEGIVVDIDPITDLAAIQLISNSHVRFCILNIFSLFLLFSFFFTKNSALSTVFD